ncbi:hypothetical protein [Streptomyces sp. NPDC050504]|uniref:hypothetical protein n=1 Tax=Streptomyces sp. NPDC050504 TaxID=3365618 RepID=UPI00378AD9D0
MTVDPTDPSTFDEYAEYAEGADGTVAELDAETPEADAVEQHAELQPHHDDPVVGYDPAAADVADVAEQARVVDLDEDDYR